MHSDTVPRENILDYPSWNLIKNGSEQAVRLLEGGRSGKSLIARIEGHADRDEAAVLIGSEIFVWRDDLPRLEPGEFYWADLVGCAVHDVAGLRFGSVIRLFETGANDVMVVSDERGDDGSGRSSAEILIPWVRPDVIVAIDLQARRIEVDWDPEY